MHHLQMEKYRSLVSDYSLFGYKWNDKIEKLIKYTHNDSSFYKFENKDNFILDNFNIEVVSENLKIITVSSYVIHNKELVNSENGIDVNIDTSSFNDNNAYGSTYQNLLNKLITYVSSNNKNSTKSTKGGVERSTNKSSTNKSRNNISKFIVKIVENEQIFTIMDVNYNILNISQNIPSEAGYKCSTSLVFNIVNNFIQTK